MTNSLSLGRRVARRLRGPAEASQPAPSRPTPRTIGPQGIPGRLLRVTNTPDDVKRLPEREVSDPTEASAVRAGWLLIDAYERLSRNAADRVFGHELAAWHQYAADTILDLEYTLPNGKVLPQESKKNRLRFRRMTDFAQPGDHVYDVGFGRGILAAQLVKGRDIASYHGIEIVSTNVPTAEALFEVNGLADRPIHLEAGDLFDLTRDKIEAAGANFVICCEVLEHVDDAEKALKTIADALPEGADLLFSVPLHGRLERAWGHLSVFDVARLKGMLAGAGLHAHHVEPLANTWSLIVASRDPGPSARVRDAAYRPAESVSAPLSLHRHFVDLRATDIAATSGTVVAADDMTVTATLRSGDGVTFPVKSLESLRFKFWFTDAAQVSRFTATALAGDEVVGTWVWRTKPGETSSKAPLRVSMRPGEVGQEFVSGPHKGVGTADRVQLVAELPTGESATFNLSAAYLP